jgi:hypothetical protein
VGARSRAENLEDQPGSVDDLGLPPPFEIALLHRAQRGVDDNEPDIVFTDQFAKIFDPAAAEEAARTRAAKMSYFGVNHIEADSLGEPDCFF